MAAKKQETAKSDRFGGKKAAAFGKGQKDKKHPGKDSKKPVPKNARNKER
jgi:hypothetical protein